MESGGRRAGTSGAAAEVGRWAERRASGLGDRASRVPDPGDHVVPGRRRGRGRRGGRNGIGMQRRTPRAPARPGSRVTRTSRLGTALRTLGACDVLLEKRDPGLWHGWGSSGRGAAGQPRVPARRGSHRRCYSLACASDEPCCKGISGPQFSSFSFLTPPLARLPDARAP